MGGLVAELIASRQCHRRTSTVASSLVIDGDTLPSSLLTPIVGGAGLSCTFYLSPQPGAAPLRLGRGSQVYPVWTARATIFWAAWSRCDGDTAVITAPPLRPQRWRDGALQGKAYVFYRNQGGPPRTPRWGRGWPKLTTPDAARGHFGLQRVAQRRLLRRCRGRSVYPRTFKINRCVATLLPRNEGMDSDAWGQGGQLTPTPTHRTTSALAS